MVLQSQSVVWRPANDTPDQHVTAASTGQLDTHSSPSQRYPLNLSPSLGHHQLTGTTANLRPTEVSTNLRGGRGGAVVLILYLLLCQHLLLGGLCVRSEAVMGTLGVIFRQHATLEPHSCTVQAELSSATLEIWMFASCLFCFPTARTDNMSRAGDNDNDGQLLLSVSSFNFHRRKTRRNLTERRVWWMLF